MSELSERQEYKSGQADELERQAKEIEALKAATHVPADEYEALRQLQFYTRIPGQENMVLRFLKEIEDCDHRKNAAIAQQKEMK